jgi:hypothetical protein
MNGALKIINKSLDMKKYVGGPNTKCVVKLFLKQLQGKTCK